MAKSFLRLVLVCLLIAGVIGCWETYQSWKTSVTTASIPEVSHQVVLQKITSMGRLELVKYNFKDVVESTIKRELLPDAKVLMVIAGEATGCLDLTKIRISDLSLQQDTIIVHLPEPDICYFKIDHSQSKVYDTQFTFMDEAKLVDEAFKKAEVQVKQSALQMKILDETKASAEQILKPFIEEVSGKKALLRYALHDTPRRLK